MWGLEFYLKSLKRRIHSSICGVRRTRGWRTRERDEGDIAREDRPAVPGSKGRPKVTLQD